MPRKKTTARRGRGEGQVREYRPGRWQARAPGGSPTKAGFRSKQDALDWLRTVAPVAGGLSGTLGEWLDAWLVVHVARTEPGTHRRDQSSVKLQIRPHLGPVRLRDLTTSRIDRWLADLAAAGVSPRERKRSWETLRTCLRAHDTFPRDTLARVRPPKVRKAEAKFLTPEQYRHLVATAVTWEGTHPYLEAMCRVWCEACLRPREMTPLLWEDYDGAVLKVRRAKCPRTERVKALKTEGSARDVPLGPQAVAALNAWRARCPSPTVMFPTPRKRAMWCFTNFSSAVWRPFLAACGVPGYGGYVLRHTGATIMMTNCLPIHDVARRMGHTSPGQILATYGHAIPANQARLTAVFAALG